MYFARATQPDFFALDESQVAIDKIRSGAEQARLPNPIRAHRFDSETQSLEDIKDANADQWRTDVTVFAYARSLLHPLTEAGGKRTLGIG